MAHILLNIALLLSFVIPIQAQEITVIVDDRASRIDAYYQSHDMPLFGYGKKMVAEADKNEIDWRLIPAISVRESSGGIHKCKSVPNSHLGYGSCKIGFESTEQEIELVAAKLGKGKYYAGKSTEEKLRTYNPPSVLPAYPQQVMKIMEEF